MDATSLSFFLRFSTLIECYFHLRLINLSSPMHKYLSLLSFFSLTSLHSTTFTRILSALLFSFAIFLLHPTYSASIFLPTSYAVSAVIGHHCVKQSSISLPSKTHHHLFSAHWHHHCSHLSRRQMSSQSAVEPFALRHYRSFLHYRIEGIWREVHSC